MTLNLERLLKGRNLETGKIGLDTILYNHLNMVGRCVIVTLICKDHNQQTIWFVMILKAHCCYDLCGQV